MRLIDQYRRLHALLQGQDEQPGLPALAQGLHCSERNVRILLGKMQQQGWLRWEAARGRGHLSRLSLLQTPQTAAMEHLSGLLEEGELEQAFDSLDHSQRQRLVERLPEFLGLMDGDNTQLRMSLYRAVQSLDPLDVTSRLEAHLVRQIFARLTEFDPVSRQIVPALAHHWECADGGSTWHFWLRPGLIFHDGTPLQREDVRQTLLRLRDTPFYYQPLYKNLQSVELDGGDGRDAGVGAGSRISCKLAQPDYLWPHRLATANASIVPRARKNDFGRMPVGSGPFKLVRNNEYRITLQAFKEYYRERALLDQVDLWMMAPPAGAEPFDLQFGHSDTTMLDTTGKARDVLSQSQAGCTYLVCNSRRPAFAKAEQRLALADWLAPTNLIAAGDVQRRPAAGILSAWKHRVAESRKRYTRLQGKQLTLVAWNTQEMMKLAAAVIARLEKAGASVRLVTLPNAPAGSDWQQHADLMLENEIINADEDFGCYEWFAADNVIRQWMSDECDAVVEQQLTAIQAMPLSTRRMAAYEELGRQLVQQGWIIPILHEHQQIQAAPHVAGLRATPLGFASFSELWIRGQGPGG
ncbi:SgrR family transcriptional regulator [Undibacterium sp. TJN25]|uniref:SgrR family transcriptional regulator n=1 Tax=Undibacterium sp. TJN25 TaxID=3413056 RepID=UPI003BEF5DD0